MEDMHHFSQIRIGNRVVYNGVNGDAFSFGDNPPTASNTDTSEDEHSTSRLSVGSDLSVASPFTPDKFPHKAPRTVALNAKQLETTFEFGTKKNDSIQTLSLAPMLGTAIANSAQLTKEDLRLHIRQSSELHPLWNSASPLQPLTPASVGLPPILPPPPAAHLPPPLPSRPPSAVPSPASSMSSLLSFKQDDRSFATPPPSPTQTAEAPSGNENSPSPHHIRSFFFRSSGTIKVEAPSRDLQHSPSHPPLSPPPLPLPVPFSPTSSSSTSPLTGVKTTTQPSHPHASANPTLATASILLSPPPTLSLSTTPSTSSKNESEEDEDTVDNSTNTKATDCQSSSLIATPLATSPGGQLISARDGELFSKKIKRATQQNNEVNRNIIPPEFESIRKQSLTYADVISNVLMFYKLNKGKKKKKIPYVHPKLEKASHCRKCGRQFSLRNFRHHCSRCKKSFCETCILVMRVDTDEQEQQTSSLTRVCDLCSEEIAFEASRGTYRGLWSEFKQMRDEARAQRGLDVTSSTIHKSLESQSMLDVTPGLMSLCLRFLGDIHQELGKQPRHKFLVNYLHFENPAQNRLKGKMIKNKECQACSRQLRMLTDIRDCNICEQTFCMNCTYRTLQMYLPPGTDLTGDIRIERVKFHVKATEQDEVECSEVSEVYRVCADCEDDIARNLRINKFNQKIPEIEAEMFDLQRQIDHALTYGPNLHGLRRSVSANNLYHMNEHESMATNIKLANQLYSRYMRAYDNLVHMEPQTAGQKALHKHIKQAMYDFYLKRKNQLESTLRSHNFWTNPSNEIP